MKISEIAEIVLPPKFSSKTPNINELKKSAKFADMLSDVINKQSGNVNAVQENQLLYQPREDIIATLSMTPFTRRCKKCSRIIESGDYCQDCAKELALSKYTLSDSTFKEDISTRAWQKSPDDTRKDAEIFVNSKVTADLKKGSDKYNSIVKEYCTRFIGKYNDEAIKLAESYIDSIITKKKNEALINDKTFQAPALDIGR